MSIEACIAHAIHNDLNILEAFPEIQKVPVDQIEPYVERFVLEVQEALYRIITMSGEPYLRSRDAAGLCATCLESGVRLPSHILLRMCQTIVQLSTIESRFILDTEEGKSLYYVKVAIT